MHTATEKNNVPRSFALGKVGKQTRHNTSKSLIFAPENKSNIKEWNMNARVSSEEG